MDLTTERGGLKTHASLSKVLGSFEKPFGKNVYKTLKLEKYVKVLRNLEYVLLLAKTWGKIYF